MSYITDILIHGANSEIIDKINLWLENHAEGQHFNRIDMDAAGGHKSYCPDVWAASLNYCPVDLFSILKQPTTWGVGLLSVMIIIDDEEFNETITFTCGPNTAHRVRTEYGTADYSQYMASEIATIPKSGSRTIPREMIDGWPPAKALNG